MKCDVCQNNNASVFLTQVVGAKVQKVNLCDACAKLKGVTDPTGFDLAELLKGMGNESVQKNSSRGRICGYCGFSQADFKKTGRLGCSECYDVFEEGLEGLLKAMHQGMEHVGKVPARHRTPEQKMLELQDLQARLAHSVESEDYEEAARIRDEIRRLETRIVTAES